MPGPRSIQRRRAELCHFRGVRMVFPGQGLHPAGTRCCDAVYVVAVRPLRRPRVWDAAGGVPRDTLLSSIPSRAPEIGLNRTNGYTTAPSTTCNHPNAQVSRAQRRGLLCRWAPGGGTSPSVLHGQAAPTRFASLPGSEHDPPQAQVRPSIAQHRGTGTPQASIGRPSRHRIPTPAAGEIDAESRAQSTQQATVARTSKRTEVPEFSRDIGRIRGRRAS